MPPQSTRRWTPRCQRQLATLLAIALAIGAVLAEPPPDPTSPPPALAPVPSPPSSRADAQLVKAYHNPRDASADPTARTSVLTQAYGTPLAGPSTRLEQPYDTPSDGSAGRTAAIRTGLLDSCPKRPAVVGYAPAYVRLSEFAVMLRFVAPYSFDDCGAAYGCVLSVSGRGAVVNGSLRALDGTATTYRIKVAVSSEGPVDILLRDDPCDTTATTPAALNVTADTTTPTCALSLASPPTLSNASFTVLAAFSEPVLPVLLASIATTACRVAAVAWTSTSRAFLTVEADPGVTAQLQLSSYAYSDAAGNPGSPSNRLAVAVPSRIVTGAAAAAKYGSLAAVGAAAAACAATAVLAPGWDSVACAGGVLRSLGHLQVLSFAEGLAFHTPAAFQDAARAAAWSRLGWLPGGSLSWAGGSSNRLKALNSAVPPPPPPVLDSYSGALERSLREAGMASPSPYTSYGSTSRAATAASFSPLAGLPGALVWNASALPDPEPTVTAAWVAAVSVLLMAIILVGAAVLAHVVIMIVTDRDMRLMGHSCYVAWPKLLLILAFAACPPLVFTAARVLSTEGAGPGRARPPAAAWVLLTVAMIATIATVAWLSYVVWVLTQRKLLPPEPKVDKQPPSTPPDPAPGTPVRMHSPDRVEHAAPPPATAAAAGPDPVPEQLFRSRSPADGAAHPAGAAAPPDAAGPLRVTDVDSAPPPPYGMMMPYNNNNFNYNRQMQMQQQLQQLQQLQQMQQMRMMQQPYGYGAPMQQMGAVPPPYYNMPPPPPRAPMAPPPAPPPPSEARYLPGPVAESADRTPEQPVHPLPRAQPAATPSGRSWAAAGAKRPRLQQMPAQASPGGGGGSRWGGGTEGQAPTLTRRAAGIGRPLPVALRPPVAVPLRHGGSSGSGSASPAAKATGGGGGSSDGSGSSAASPAAKAVGGGSRSRSGSGSGSDSASPTAKAAGGGGGSTCGNGSGGGNAGIDAASPAPEILIGDVSGGGGGGGGSGGGRLGPPPLLVLPRRSRRCRQHHLLQPQQPDVAPGAAGSRASGVGAPATPSAPSVAAGSPLAPGGGSAATSAAASWYGIAAASDEATSATTSAPAAARGGRAAAGPVAEGRDSGCGSGGGGGGRAAAGPVAEGRDSGGAAAPEKRVSKIRESRRVLGATIAARPVPGFVPAPRAPEPEDPAAAAAPAAGPQAKGKAARRAANNGGGGGRGRVSEEEGEAAGLAGWLKPPPGGHAGPVKAPKTRAGHHGEGGADASYGGGGYDGYGGYTSYATGVAAAPPRGVPNDRSTFCASYGWLVAEALGCTEEVAAARARRRRLLAANLVSLGRSLVLAVLTGAWAARTAQGSATQLSMALVVCGAWLSYILAVRPYIGMGVLAAEAALGVLEAGVVLMGLLVQSGVRTGSPASLAIVALFLALFGVVALEAARAVVVGRVVWRRMQGGGVAEEEGEAAGLVAVVRAAKGRLRRGRGRVAGEPAGGAPGWDGRVPGA